MDAMCRNKIFGQEGPDAAADNAEDSDGA